MAPTPLRAARDFQVGASSNPTQDDPMTRLTPIPLLSAALSTLLAAQQPTLLADLHPGPGSAVGTDQYVTLHPSGDFGLLLLQDGVHGRELWRTDGTGAGTQLLFDFTPGPASAELSLFAVAVQDEFWFTDRIDQPSNRHPNLWRIDAASSTPRVLLDGTQLGVVNFGSNGATAGGDGLVFALPGAQAPWELWRVDPAGNHQVIWTSPRPSFPFADPFFWAQTGEFALFRDDAGNLLVTDGTPAGTAPATSNGGDFVGPALGGLMVRDPVTLTGGVAGTQLSVLRAGRPPLTMTVPSRAVQAYGFRDLALVLVDDQDLFALDDSGSPRRLATLVPGSNPGLPQNLFGLTDLDGVFTFFADGNNGAGRELWRSDGTAAGTVMVADLLPGPNGFAVDAALHVGDRMVFWGSTPGLGSEPWSTDGTAAGTIQLGDLEPGPGSSVPAFWIWPPSHAALLGIRTSAHGLEPWWCDGTPQGTRLAADIRPGPDSSLAIDPFSALLLGSVVKDRAVFPANDGTHGVELWTAPLPAYQLPIDGHACARQRDLELEGWPKLGGAVGLRANGLTANDRGAVVASLAGHGPLTFVDGCGVRIDPATALTAAVVVPNANGSFAQSVAVPNQTALLGSQLAFQAAFLDATSPLGWRPSRPWRVTIGR